MTETEIKTIVRQTVLELKSEPDYYDLKITQSEAWRLRGSSRSKIDKAIRTGKLRVAECKNFNKARKYFYLRDVVRILNTKK